MQIISWYYHRVVCYLHFWFPLAICIYIYDFTCLPRRRLSCFAQDLSCLILLDFARVNCGKARLIFFFMLMCAFGATWVFSKAFIIIFLLAKRIITTQTQLSRFPILNFTVCSADSLCCVYIHIIVMYIGTGAHSHTLNANFCTFHYFIRS